jgi:uncharacterized protein YggU (UPF0235/DUF167 family)
LKLRVTVKPGSRHESVERAADGALVVRVNAPAREGKANDAAVAAVAGFYRVPKSAVRLISGARSRTKVLLLPDP